VLTERLAVPLKERWILKRSLTARAYETFPAPLPTQRLYGSLAITYWLLAAFALWQAQSYMTGLTVRMSAIYGKADVVFTTDETTVARKRLLA